ncbi:MAG: CarD family transcriptional regulator [Candidatus Midichloriaceae bacterium]
MVVYNKIDIQIDLLLRSIVILSPKRLNKCSFMEHVLCFKVGDSVVYPTHGVGEIIGEEKQSYSGIEILVYVINFAASNLILRIPIARVKKVGLRHIVSSKSFDKAFEVLSGRRIRMDKLMWSKRVQKYETKINSGDIIAIAEVIKELHCNAEKTDRSYSEKIIYNDAVERLAGEYAVINKLKLSEAINKISDKL